MKSNLFPNFKTNSINNKKKYVIKEIETEKSSINKEWKPG